MLVLFVALAILGAFLAEILFHHFRNNYEIEWVALREKTGGEIAEEIIRSLRENQVANLNAR